MKCKFYHILQDQTVATKKLPLMHSNSCLRLAALSFLKNHHRVCPQSNKTLGKKTGKSAIKQDAVPNRWGFWRMLYSNSASRSGNIICTASRLGRKCCHPERLNCHQITHGKILKNINLSQKSRIPVVTLATKSSTATACWRPNLPGKFGQKRGI